MYSRLFGGGALSATRFSSQKWLKSSGLGGFLCLVQNGRLWYLVFDVHTGRGLLPQFSNTKDAHDTVAVGGMLQLQGSLHVVRPEQVNMWWTGGESEHMALLHYIHVPVCTQPESSWNFGPGSEVHRSVLLQLSGQNGGKQFGRQVGVSR